MVSVDGEGENVPPPTSMAAVSADSHPFARLPPVAFAETVRGKPAGTFPPTLEGASDENFSSQAEKVQGAWRKPQASGAHPRQALIKDCNVGPAQSPGLLRRIYWSCQLLKTLKV